MDSEFQADAVRGEADALRRGFEQRLEAVAACPTNFGRQNKIGAPAAMMEWQKEHGVMKAAWETLSPEERQEKFPIGVLSERNDVKEYTAAYEEILQRAKGGAAG